MAFENPFLTPSATRQAALKSLWYDEPASSNIVRNIFGIPSYTNLAEPTVITGIEKGGGGGIENSVGGIDNERLLNTIEEIANYENINNTEFESPDPIGDFKFLEDNKSLIKTGLNALGVPLVNSAINAYEQYKANDILDRVEAWVGPEGGTPVEQGSVVGAGIKGLLPFNIGNLIKSDSVEAAKSLTNAFETTGAMDGYFRAAFDPTIEQITGGMFTDTSNITPAQFGTVAQAVNDRIYDNVTQGMTLNQAQNEAVEFFNPQTAVSIPVASPEPVEVTPIEPLFPTAVSTPVTSPEPVEVTPIEPEFTYVAPEPTYIEPEPTYIEPEPTYVEPEFSYVAPEPTYIEPQSTYVAPEPTYIEPQPTYVEPEFSYVEPSYSEIIDLFSPLFTDMTDPFAAIGYGYDFGAPSWKTFEFIPSSPIGGGRMIDDYRYYNLNE